MTWLLTAAAIIAALMVSSGRPRLVFWANAVWVVSDLGLMARNMALGETEQAVLFGVFSVIAIAGMWQWRDRVWT